MKQNYVILLCVLTFSYFNCFSQKKMLNQDVSKYSIHLGCGFSNYFLSSSTNNLISDPIGPIINLNISKNKEILLVSMIFGASQVQSQTLTLDTLKLNYKSEFVVRTSSVSYGHRFNINNRLFVYPFGGIVISNFLIKDKEKKPITYGFTGGIALHFILNPDNEKGRFLYAFMNTRFDWIFLKEINSKFDNTAFVPEIGFAFRFAANERK